MKPTDVSCCMLKYETTYFANDSCWWFVMFANFFITFEKAKKKSWKRATTNSSAKKLRKSTLKKDVEKSLLVLSTSWCATRGW